MKNERRPSWNGLIFAVFLILLEVTLTAASSPSPTTSETQPITVANAGSVAQIRWANPSPGSPVNLALSPDGKTLAVATTYNILVYDLGNLETSLFELDGQKTLSRVMFSPDGEILASAGSHFDGTIWLWDMPKGGVKRTVLEGHTEAIYGIAFSPNGKLLASGSRDDSVRVWDVKTGKELFFSMEHNGEVHSVAFSTDGATLASGGRDGKIRLWDVESSQEKKVLDAHPIQVDCLAFSPDGKLLASAGQYDSAIRLWDTQNWQTIKILRGHVESAGGKGVFSLAFNDQGTLLASGGRDKSIRLWDVVNPDSPSFGKQLVALQRHSDWVDSLIFSPEGVVLISASERDGTIRIWESTQTTTSAIISQPPTTATAPNSDSQTFSPPTFSPTITPTPTTTNVSKWLKSNWYWFVMALVGLGAFIIKLKEHLDKKKGKEKEWVEKIGKDLLVPIRDKINIDKSHFNRIDSASFPQFLVLNFGTRTTNLHENLNNFAKKIFPIRWRVLSYYINEYDKTCFEINKKIDELRMETRRKKITKSRYSKLGEEEVLDDAYEAEIEEIFEAEGLNKLGKKREREERYKILVEKKSESENLIEKIESIKKLYSRKKADKLIDKLNKLIKYIEIEYMLDINHPKYNP